MSKSKHPKQAGIVPALRFHEFQKAKPWDSVPIGSLTTPVNKQVGKRSLIPVSITAGVGFVKQSSKFGRDISGEQYQRYTVLEQGDFSFNKGNSKTYPQGCVYSLKQSAPVAAPNVFISFRFNPGNSPEFFEQCFEMNWHGHQLAKVITSGARSNGLLNISKDDFYSVTLPYPQPDEQRKIANCLSSIDKLIAAQAKKVDALKAHKNGLMQQLFPAEGTDKPNMHLGENGKWKPQRLDALALRGSGHTPSKDNAANYNGGVMWVSLADLKRLDTGLITETTHELSPLGIQNSSAKLHPEGTVLLSRDAAVGKSAVMSQPMAVSQHFMTWTCKDGRLHNWFLYYLLQHMKTIFEREAIGSTIKTIGLPFFRNLVIHLPSIGEQERVADCILFLDTAIENAIAQQEGMQFHKRGLMQQLFPSIEDASK